ncbi:DUF2760 domain-containing protein [Pendulispora albinea]|uniref:DUF2760 domain-containing protein n=1 Tax=Pendulispora albinea TaxID=2741071 RepID=A0ABZ2M847_9BACT
MTETTALPTQLPFLTRLWFAWLAFFRVLFDGAFAARVWGAQSPEALPPARPAPSPEPVRELEAPKAAPASDRAPAKPANEAPAATVETPAPARTSTATAVAAATASKAESSVEGALQLLALFQREGRLVDFLTQEIAPFGDAEIGATARVIHEGCRKALLSHATIVPVRAENEDSPVTLNTGFDPAEVKLTGNVKGSGPYRGILRHRGWRAKEIALPAAVPGHDATILCPAEVEL